MKIIFFLLLFYAINISAKNHLEMLAHNFGVDPILLAQLFKNQTIKSSTKECFGLIKLTPNTENRDKLLKCLIENQNDFVSELFFKILFEYQNSLIYKKFDHEIEKSIALNNFLLDFARSKLAQTRPSSWYSYENGKGKFLSLGNNQRDDFPYEEGDLVLAYGGNGTSGIVGESMSPVFRYSHAFIASKDDNELITLETLPHTGARVFTKNDLKDEKYTSMVVLRWKDPLQRNLIKNRAVAFAKKWANEKIIFDFSMKGTDEKKLYCTQMAAKAYSSAAEKTLEEIFPDQLVTTSTSARRISADMGVNMHYNMILPRSILNSPYFEIVAEFRDTNKLFHYWQIKKITELSIQMYNVSYTLKSSMIFNYIDFLFKIPFLNIFKTVNKSKNISIGIGREKFAKLATYETFIVGKLVKISNKTINHRSFHQVPLWEINQDIENNFLKSNEFFTLNK